LRGLPFALGSEAGRCATERIWSKFRAEGGGHRQIDASRSAGVQCVGARSAHRLSRQTIVSDEAGASSQFGAAALDKAERSRSD